MTTEFKIDIQHQLKSFRKCFLTLALTIGVFIVGLFLIEDLDYKTWIVICGLFWLVTSVLMVLPFHINYLIVNWNTKLIVNHNLESITIIQSGKTFDYGMSDIKVTRRILGHYRRGRTKSWTPIPFDYYGYLVVDTNDNKEFYFTSLMLDPFKPPLPVDNNEYEFPLILKFRNYSS